MIIEWLVAAISGYLLGSVSFSRIVASRVVPDEEIVSTTYTIGDGGYEIEAVGHSPGAVAQRAGPRAGGLSTVGDMAKAALATGVAWLVFDRDAAAVAGAAAVLGHVAPLYHGFKGAFGLSPIIGSTLVLSPIGLPFALVAANATAFVTAELAWSSNLWPLFLVLWGVLFSDDAYTGFAIAANVLWMWRVWPQVSHRVQYRRENSMPRRERIAELIALYRMNPYELGLPQDERQDDPQDGGRDGGQDGGQDGDTQDGGQVGGDDPGTAGTSGTAG